MNHPSIVCDEPPLEVLLTGDESSTEFRRLAEHIESCVRCQRRLTRLAADDAEWNDISSLLRGYPPATDFAGGGGAAPMQVSQADLSFLALPSHPEMLGRLGRYEIERVIGAGGMGIVLKGYDTELQRPVAIKVLAPHLAHSGAARLRFAREGRAAAAVVHEHVVAIHNVETQGDVPYLVMQYVPGQSLQSRVDQQGPLAVAEILRIGVQAAAGLAAAHAQGVVHRDVKPSNILLENDVERALLTDFGLARAADDATVTRTGVIAGTPHYMSPEQALGGTVDEKSDLFGLGALLYFMATGHPPFRAEKPLAVLNRICRDRHRPVWEINPEVPDGLSDVIDRLLEKKPHKRFATADEARAALLKVLGHLQQPATARRRSAFRRRLRAWRPWLLGMAALALVASVGMFTSHVFKTELPPAPQEPPAPVADQDAQPPGDLPSAVSQLLKTDIGRTDAFDSELVETQHLLREMETTYAASAGAHARSDGDDWHRDAQELQRRLSVMESSFPMNPESTGAKQ
ncbi:MAG: serine/threonine-protein kinase [Planctomycetaceae bacterium]